MTDRYAPGRWVDRWERSSGRMFSVAGRPVATDPLADNFVCNLWNPDSVRSLWVTEFGFSTASAAAALDPLRLCRTSTRGTAPGSTITPDLDNDFEREITPDTGAVLDLANFTLEPTIQTPDLYRLAFPLTGTVHSLTWLFPGVGIRVPPGTGLGLATTGAVATSTPITVYFSFTE